MRHPKHYSVLEVLNFTDVGLAFEFYSTKESNFIVDNLTKLASKNIVLTNEAKYVPTYTHAILLKEYDASRSRYKFSLAPQNYHSILPIIDSVCEWISESCETTFDTQLKVSINFNHQHLDTLSSISQMNPARLILKFDENEVYKRFPTQKGSPYGLSIKKFAPITTFVNEADIEDNIKYVMNTPEAGFYGIDFTNYTRGILECNYIGGKGYSTKPNEIKDVLEYLVIKVYQSINEEEYSVYEQNEIKRLTHGFDKIQMAYYDPTIFLTEFANIKVYVDLKRSDQILKTFWTAIRKPIFEMIINGGLREGTINYDADLGKLQLRNATITAMKLDNMDFVKCELGGILENSSFVACKINKARVYNSKIIRDNEINESYLQGVSVNQSNEITKCYVVNNEEIINGDIKESVIKFATPGKNMKIDENSTVVVKELPLPKKDEAVNIEKIRDYTYIKKMNNSEDKGFQNAYNRKTYLKRDINYEKLT
jgi:hypothetical protein